MPRGGNSFRAVGARVGGPLCRSKHGIYGGRVSATVACCLSRFRLTTAAAGV